MYGMYGCEFPCEICWQPPRLLIDNYAVCACHGRVYRQALQGPGVTPVAANNWELFRQGPPRGTLIRQAKFRVGFAAPWCSEEILNAAVEAAKLADEFDLAAQLEYNWWVASL